jgi:acyl-CoA reductase-like NAD-dependent aldehyde dehydrogenase
LRPVVTSFHPQAIARVNRQQIGVKRDSALRRFVAQLDLNTVSHIHMEDQRRGGLLARQQRLFVCLKDIDLAHLGRQHGQSSLDHGDLAHGHFCAPTIARAPLDHPLWERELFAPFVLVAPVDDVAQAIALVNASDYGLTAGFYGSADETERFFDTVQAGVCYANRPQGATTGAWPGYQPFGGWKGSGSTGRAAGSQYYVTQYMREQSQTRIRRG